MAAHPSTKFQQGMNERRRRGELCDFEIKVQGQTFPVHRLVLDTCSEYFRRMFVSNMKEAIEGVCELKDKKAEIVETCINFMYTEELHMAADMDAVIHILEITHMWQLNKAVKLCEDSLRSNLDATCCFLYRRLACRYDLNNLLSRCNDFIFSRMKVIQNSAEIAEVEFDEMKDLLQAWKQHCDKGDPVISSTRRKRWHAMSTTQVVKNKESNLEFWKLCSRWSEYKPRSDFTKFCEIVELFRIENLLVLDFIETVIQERHIKECKNCKKSVCERFLKSENAAAGITIKNCLILKHLANNYNCEQIKQRLTVFIVQNYKAVSTKPEFNELVPPDDFVAYIECLKQQAFSSQKFSVVASWIRFSPGREDIFPKLFKDKQLEYKDLGRLFKREDVLFIKSLSHDYSCEEVHTAAVEFIVKNFAGIIELPESLQIQSMDLVSYFQKLKYYGNDPTEIWHFIQKWVNHDPENRKKEFPAVFQALNLEMFSFTFIRGTILKSDLVKESSDCNSHLLDFIFSKLESLCEGTPGR